MARAACSRKRKKRRRCAPKVDLGQDRGYAPTAPDGGNNPDLLAPWPAPVALVAGGPCGAFALQEAHQDFDARWEDDRFAIDFGLCGAADNQTPVLAAHSGIVRVAGDSYDYGTTVVIERTRNGLATRYAHLDPQLKVRVGDRVQAGQPIGAIGYTGLGDGRDDDAHLHFVMYKSRALHAGRPIRRLARQVVEDGLVIVSRSFETGTTPKPVSHYNCPTTSTQLANGLLPEAFYTEPFTTAGTLITDGTVDLRAQDDKADKMPHHAKIGVYDGPDPRTANPLRELIVEVPISAAGVTFTLSPPLVVAPGRPLWLGVVAIDRVLYYTQDVPQPNPNNQVLPHHCWIAAVRGTE